MSQVPISHWMPRPKSDPFIVPDASRRDRYGRPTGGVAEVERRSALPGYFAPRATAVAPGANPGWQAPTAAGSMDIYKRFGGTGPGLTQQPQDWVAPHGPDMYRPLPGVMSAGTGLTESPTGELVGRTPAPIVSRFSLTGSAAPGVVTAGGEQMGPRAPMGNLMNAPLQTGEVALSTERYYQRKDARDARNRDQEERRGGRRTAYGASQGGLPY